MNSSAGMTTLTLSKVETFLDAFVQNASATLGVQVSGKETRLTIHSLRITFPISEVNDPDDLKKRTPCPGIETMTLIYRGDVRVVMPLMTLLCKI